MQNQLFNPSDLTPFLYYQHGNLHFEGANVCNLAKQFGTALYVYSAGEIRRAFQSYANACPEHNITVCYAVKANSNIHLLKLLVSLGAGFDVVSAGELGRVIHAGGKASKAVFAGVGKTSEEIQYAIEQGVGCFNVESAQEMARIGEIAGRLNTKTRVSLRVNPDVDAKTHPYISTGLKENKFGVSMKAAREVYRFAADHPWLEVHGIDCHIGSQLTDDSPYYDALEKVLGLVKTLAQEDKIQINHLDLGGGIGIRYLDETPPCPSEVLRKLAERVQQWATENSRPMPSLSFEPGRSIVGNAGILVAEVQYTKSNEDKHFAIVDAAMNDLMRPALYNAFHAVVPLNQTQESEAQTFDIVGPVCETGDWLAKGRSLSLQQGDLLAFLSAGAYGQTMASNYNTRGRVAEVLVDEGKVSLIRRRETLNDQLRTELEV